MKKVYIAPTLATYEICTEGIMALSATDNDGAPLTGSDFENTGDFEICTNKKEGNWDTQW